MALEIGNVVRLKSGGPWMTVTAVNADSRVTCTWFLPIAGTAPDQFFTSTASSTMFVEAALETREPDPAAMRMRAMTVDGADRYWRDLRPRPGERIKQYVVDLRKEREWALETCPRVEVLAHTDNTGASCRSVGSARWIDLDRDDCSTCRSLCDMQRYRSDIAVWRVQADERVGETFDRTALSDEVATDPLRTLDGYPVGQSGTRTVEVPIEERIAAHARSTRISIGDDRALVYSVSPVDFKAMVGPERLAAKVERDPLGGEFVTLMVAGGVKVRPDPDQRTGAFTRFASEARSGYQKLVDRLNADVDHQLAPPSEARTDPASR